jgi:hypothetical protein
MMMIPCCLTPCTAATMLSLLVLLSTVNVIDSFTLQQSVPCVKVLTTNSQSLLLISQLNQKWIHQQQTRTLTSSPLLSLVVLQSSNRNDVDNNKNENIEYSRDIVLREEAEAPFRKIRFFLYGSLGAAAATSFLISTTRIIAGLNGINVDLLNESLINSTVDLIGMIVLSFLWQRDVMAQNSRFKRAAKGAELAKLMIRVSKANMNESDISTIVESTDGTNEVSKSRFTTSLASLRRGRGMEKRVVIAVGNAERIERIVQEATNIQDKLQSNDLLIVPVIIEPPRGNIIPLTNMNIDTLPDIIALPMTTVSATAGSWKVVINDEMDEAIKQGIDVYQDGFCIILKKNGRVGQRTRGIYLSNMVGDVTQRREAGMDVVNI